jgi:hypothetical protein
MAEAGSETDVVGSAADSSESKSRVVLSKERKPYRS